MKSIGEEFLKKPVYVHITGSKKNSTEKDRFARILEEFHKLGLPNDHKLHSIIGKKLNVTTNTVRLVLQRAS